ncbi:MAG: hypothetical protein AB7Q01_08660 [Gammaproteobacteria bacterium]
MPSSGPHTFTTFASDSAFGNVAWSNPGNAELSDNVYATASDSGFFSTDTSEYLVATGISGLSIPSGATIDGIEVEVERSRSGGSSVTDERVRIVKAGTVGSTDKAVGTAWPTSDGSRTYGGAADLWGESWAVADLEAADTGVALAVNLSAGFGTVTARIDRIRVTVHYTEPENPTASAALVQAAAVLVATAASTPPTFSATAALLQSAALLHAVAVDASEPLPPTFSAVASLVQVAHTLAAAAGRSRAIRGPFRTRFVGGSRQQALLTRMPRIPDGTFYDEGEYDEDRYW